MRALLIAIILGFNYLVGIYYAIINFVYFGLLFSFLMAVIKPIKRIKYSPFKDLLSSPEAPPFSILIPAHNENGVILRAVNSALALKYPFFEIIVINTGSNDGTIETLIMSTGISLKPLLSGDSIITLNILTSL